MSLFEELIEDKEFNKKILKSFKGKDTLCNKIFDRIGEDYKLKEDIRKGDVDIHILIDKDEFDESETKDSVVFHKIIDDFFDSKEKVWKSKQDIKIKGFEVEMYVQDIHQEHISSGVYSVLNNKWVVVPEKMDPKIDDSKILQKGDEYEKQIDDLVSKFNSNKDVSKETKNLYKKIKSFRQSGLEKGGEYSYENLTFKLLRRNGYIGKILDLKSDIINKKLSLTQ